MTFRAAVERNGAGGLLIVIDELGKFLEYEARQGGGGVFLLQQLAERAFRGRKANFLFFVLLHQGFDLYARGMGEKLKNDWAKVQGRFESISFVESPEQTLRIVAAAFTNSLAESQRKSVRDRTTRIAISALESQGFALWSRGQTSLQVFSRRVTRSTRSRFWHCPNSVNALHKTNERCSATSAVGSHTAFRIRWPRLPKSANGFYPGISTTTSFTINRRCWLTR